MFLPVIAIIYMIYFFI